MSALPIPQRRAERPKGFLRGARERVAQALPSINHAAHNLREITTPEFVRPHLVAHHAVLKPPLVGRVVTSYARQRNHHEPAQIKTHYDFLPAAEKIPGARLLVVPGFLGYMPTETYLDEVSAAFEYGAGFISASDEDGLWILGQHLILGGPEPAVQPDWHLIVATVIDRIHADDLLQEFVAKRDGTDLPERYVLIGHSMGGLIVHALSGIVKLAREGRFDAIYRRFPNLHPSVFSPTVLDSVVKRLSNAEFVSDATPFNGISKAALLAAKASGFSFLFQGSEDRFHVDELNRHYDAIDLSPEDPDHGIDAFVYATLDGEEDLENETASQHSFERRSLSMYTPFVAIADSAFHLVGGTFIGGDGLVEEPPEHYRNRVRIPGQSHLTIVETQTAARQTRRGLARVFKPIP